MFRGNSLEAAFTEFTEHSGLFWFSILLYGREKVVFLESKWPFWAD
jgi:hypothetical protein